MKKHINELVNFSVIEKDEIITGLVIDYNDDYTIIAYNPVDYVIDGFMIFRNRIVEKYMVDDNVLKQQIINKKGINTELFFELTNASILNYFYKNNLIFSIELSNGSYFIGKINSIDLNVICFLPLSHDAEWKEEVIINIADIDIIEFKTDYIESLCLII
jgi:hypothetical protein